MKDQFDSTVMMIEIRGMTVRYAFRRAAVEVYEIREVNLFDLAKLKQTNRNSDYSSGATVQYLTHLYPESHFGPSGEKAPVSRQTKRSLEKLTPYRAPKP